MLEHATAKRWSLQDRLAEPVEESLEAALVDLIKPKAIDIHQFESLARDFVCNHAISPNLGIVSDPLQQSI